MAAWTDFLRSVGVPEEQHGSAFALVDPQGTGPRIFFQQVPEDKVAKNRLHMDVRAAPGLSGDDRMAALERECDRLVALGATRRGDRARRRHARRPHRDDGPRATSSAWTETVAAGHRPPRDPWPAAGSAGGLSPVQSTRRLT